MKFGYDVVPVTSLTVCRYAAYLAQRLSFNSIKQYLNIIRILHLECGFPNPLQDNWVLNTILKGVAKVKGTSVRQKLPITPHILLGIRHVLDFSQAQDIVFWAACLTMFFGLLRKSNVFPPSLAGFNASKHLRRLDFHFSPLNVNGGLVLNIRWSKTIQTKDRVLQCALPMLLGHPLCPVTAITHAFRITQGAPGSGPAFMLPSGSKFHPLLYSSFNVKLKGLLKALAFDPSRYSGHSFRRGGASWALMQGLPGEIIKLLGDWKSPVYLSYLSVPLTEKFRTMHLFSRDLPTS